MRSCFIYKKNDEYKFETISETDIGLDISDGPVKFLAIDCENSVFWDSLMSTLKNSRQEVKTPKKDEWKKWQSERLNLLKEKSFTELYKESKSVFIQLDHNKITIFPNKFENKNGLIRLINDKQILELLAMTQDEIINKIKKMLDNDGSGPN